MGLYFNLTNVLARRYCDSFGEGVIVLMILRNTCVPNISDWLVVPVFRKLWTQLCHPYAMRPTNLELINNNPGLVTPYGDIDLGQH